jgi:adenosyl cobinamide kinase/adenosyl cobinamide phosphate guanylyltransferase
MAKLSTHKHSATHRVLVYGAPKSGKTQLAGALAEHFDIIWIDMENGHETLFKFPQEWQERIELIDLKDTPSYPIAIETVLKIIKGAPVEVCEFHGKVGCMICKREGSPVSSIHLNEVSPDTIVVFDSLTQLTTSAINNITKKQPDDYKMQTDDWGNLSKLIEIFLSTIQQARYNCVVISHEIEAETEGKKRTLVPVAGSRNSSRNSAKAFDHVIYAERKNKKHVFASSTQYATNILTGSRTDVVMEDDGAPSLLAIFKPELYAATVEKAEIENKVQAATPAANTSDILARLRSKNKK